MTSKRWQLLRLSFPLPFSLSLPLTLGLALGLTLGLTLGFSAPPAVAAAAEKVLTFGIYAYRPPEIMLQRFAPLASYLGERLPGMRVELKAMSQEELDQAVRSHQVDLVLTNPRHYLQLRTHSHLTGSIATLVKRAFDGSPTRSLGGVIFTRAGRDDISGLADLAGQRVAIPGPYHTGGYMAQLYELEQAGLPLPAQAQLLDAGSHDAVVQQVLNGTADVGFIRTEVLEEQAADGRLDLNRIKVINRQPLADYPFISSTRLYPEWPVIALPTTDARTVRIVTATLLTLDPDGPVAMQAQIAGFDPPADYLPIEQALRTLRLSPFDQPPPYGLADLWRDYRLQLIAGALAGATILALSLLLFLRNRLLEQRGRDLTATATRLQDLTEAQRLIAEQMARLMPIRASEQDAAINGLLEAIGRLLGVDRAYLFQRDADGTHFSNTHEWCAPGIPSALERSQRLPMSATGWFWDRLAAEGIVQIDEANAVTDPLAKAVIEDQGICSLFCMALARDRARHGFVGCDMVRRQRRWNADELVPLETLISALGHALLRWQAERDLDANQRFLDTLFESIPTPVFSKDLDGRYLRVNRGFEELLGVERARLIGKTATQISPPELASVYQDQDQALLAQGPGGRQHYASHLRSPDGTLLDVLFDKAVYTDDRGHVAGLIGTVLDVTLAKQQERHIALRMQRDEALLRLPQLAEECDEVSFMQRAQAFAENLTASEIAFIHFVAGDQDTIELVNWSRRTLEGFCTAVPERHYPVRQAGIWADALRQRAPVVVNDYPGHAAKHGLPEGHAVLHRFISVPVIEDDRVVMLTGVGNKDGDYSETDVETVQLLSNEIWRLLQRRRSQQELELAASVFTQAREGILVTDPDGTILDANEAFTALTGYEHGELIGQNPRLLQSGRQGAGFYTEFWRSLRLKSHWRGEIWNRRKDGEVRAQLVTISAVRRGEEVPSRFVALYSDITEQLNYQHQLERAAHFDALTELPNRVLLADRLQQALARVRRSGAKLAVLYLDLDGFKAVNDRHGHAEGDHLLREIALRLRGCLREVDTLARLGGDEFVAVLGDLGTEQDVLPQVSRLLAAVSRPLEVAGSVAQLAASIGVTFYPQPGEVDADLLLRQADQAMYQAKLAGRNQYVLFDVEAELDQRDRHRSRDLLQQALERGELLFHYQPKVNMRRGEVIGAEALLRWAHPERGLLPPGEFLLMGADHRLMIEIGKLAVAQALDEIDAWHTQGRRLNLSVNIHAHHLQRRDFVPWLRDELARHPDLVSGQLTLEVLETSALEDLGLVRELILDCAKLGVDLSLDDFGTGYASLTYLRNLPAAEIKIDASFVRGCLDDPEDLAIIEGVLGLATAFQRRVVAEGVETVEHGRMLLALGCELAQGYAIARPMPTDDLRAWVDRWQAPQAWREGSPVAPADIPALSSMVQHRAWLGQWERLLREGGEMSAVSQTQKGLGQWLGGEGRRRYGGQPLFLAIERLHDQTHALAARLLEGVRLKDEAAAHGALQDLRAVYARLHEHILHLLQPGDSVRIP